MNRKATAVARAERQAAAEPHRPFRVEGYQKDYVVFLTPSKELVAHEFCLLDPESVLLLEFQPLLDGSLNGNVLADGFALQQGFKLGVEPLRIRLRFRPDAGLGRPLVLPTMKLLPIQRRVRSRPVELKPERAATPGVVAVVLVLAIRRVAAICGDFQGALSSHVVLRKGGIARIRVAPHLAQI